MVTYRVLEKISKILKVRYKIIMQLVHNFKDTCSLLSLLECNCYRSLWTVLEHSVAKDPIGLIVIYGWKMLLRTDAPMLSRPGFHTANRCCLNLWGGDGSKSLERFKIFPEPHLPLAKVKMQSTLTFKYKIEGSLGLYLFSIHELVYVAREETWKGPNSPSWNGE
jgi:hypothetical protein